LTDEARGAILDPKANYLSLVQIAEMGPVGDGLIADNPLCVEVIIIDPAEVEEVRN
jgi:hypothetical protein